MPDAAQFFLQIREVKDLGGSLVGVEATPVGEKFQLVYYLSVDGKVERQEYLPDDDTCPSLIQLFAAADYLERSLYRRYKIKFIGNPNLEVAL